MSTSVGLVRKRFGATETIKAKFQEYKNYIYNEDEGTILQRSKESFVKIVLFYGVFYACLFIGSIILGLFFMFIVIDANEPQRIGLDNLQKGNPGMSFLPLPDLWNPLIRFRSGIRSSYAFYIDHMQAFLDQYDAQESENFVTCSDTQRMGGADGSICHFETEDWGKECSWQKDYGYDMGQPCVLVKLNMQYGWIPEPYNRTDVPSEVMSLYDTHGESFIYVTCEGENPHDKENIGNLTFYPPWGFSHKFYPYMNQEGYIQPAVFVRFENPTSGVVISVYCKAWSYNMQHHRHDQAGSVFFQILMD